MSTVKETQGQGSRFTDGPERILQARAEILHSVQDEADQSRKERRVIGELVHEGEGGQRVDCGGVGWGWVNGWL